jgi:hypothetical protein
VYYGASNGRHTNFRQGSLYLAYFRKDGYAGYSPCATKGLIRTKKFITYADDLLINAIVSHGGAVRTAILGADGIAIKGFGLRDCKPVKRDAVDQIFKWKGLSLDALRGKTVSILFEISGYSAIYSFAGATMTDDKH